MNSQESPGEDRLIARRSFPSQLMKLKVQDIFQDPVSILFIILHYLSFRAPKFYKVQAHFDVPQSSVGKPDLPFWRFSARFSITLTASSTLRVFAPSALVPGRAPLGVQGRASASCLGGDL